MKKITKAKIIRELIDAYKLVDSTQEEFLLSETVVPVTNLDDRSREIFMNDGTFSAAATNWITLVNPASTYRYYVKAISVKLTTGTTARINRIAIYNIDANYIVDLIPSTEVTEAQVRFDTPLILESPFTLRCYISTANAGDVFTHCYYTYRESIGATK